MSDPQRSPGEPLEQLVDNGTGSDGNPLSEGSSSANHQSPRSTGSNTYIFPIRSVYSNRGVAGGPGGPTSPKLGSPPGELHRMLSGQGDSSPRAEPMSPSVFDMLETTATSSSAGRSSTATLSRRPLVSPNPAGPQGTDSSTVPSPPPPPPLVKKDSSGASSERGKTRLEPDDAGVPNLVNDFSAIVRLGDAPQTGTATVEGSSTASPTISPTVTKGVPPVPSNEPGQASLGGLMRKANPTASASMRAQTRDNVRNFVNEQAHTVQMKDPNAATPSPGPDATDTSSLGSSLSAQPSSGSESLSSSRESRDLYVPRPVAANRWRPFGDTVSDEHSYPSTTVPSDQLEHSGRDSSMGNIAPEEPFTTFRFQHLDTEDGHHVITGREGKLERCEDEPITIPGAVQGFGVLVLLEEDLDTGDLTVRQVSENSTELLGLSPQYLFRLRCFSNILTGDQEDILRDNVEALPYPDDHSPETLAEYGGPQVFRLTGFGEPGSDDTWDEEGSGEIPTLRRREWTCWVAASRPKMEGWVKYDAHGKPLPVPDLIILEFELERDNYNPLTQPFDTYADTGTPESFDNLSRRDSAPKPAAKSVGGASRTSKISNMRTTSFQSESAGRRSSSGLGVPVQPSATANSEMRSGSQSELPSGSTMPTSIQESGAASSKWPGSASTTSSARRREGVEGLDIDPPLERVLESTTNYAKPLRSLVGMRRAGMDTWSDGEALSSNSSGDQSSGKRPPTAKSRASRAARSRRSMRRAGAPSSSDALDVVTVLNQINEQLGRARDLDSFLKITVGIVKDLCRFHRVICYQFDEEYNGKVTTELVDWGSTTDLWKGLLFPAADIPPQARELYRINKVRFLYDRSQITARLVLRYKEDLDTPLDMTHCFLRAMSPIHLQYLANMRVRSSMSISIMAFGKLWGLIACHSYGSHGMRVSFPVRQMLRLMSDVVSRNVERLQYAHRLRSRQLIDAPVGIRTAGGSVNSDSSASQEYIVSNADELLSIFDADMGLLVINDGCKLLGQSEQAHTMLAIAEYLRIAKFDTIVASSHITKDFPDLMLPRATDTIAGLLYVPLTNEAGQDFIVLLRKGQVDEVKWAGRPYINEDAENKAVLEPRKSFKLWVQKVTGRSRQWNDDEIDSAKVLSLIYGKFIHVWREKQSASMSNQLTAILLSNTSHAVRTPLSQIINTLELALAGNIDNDTRNMLENSHQASRALLFHVHDLLDLTRIETGNETAFNDPFDIKETINTTVRLYQTETTRRGIAFVVTMADDLPPTVIGDARKIKTVISNLVANAVKYTRKGTIEVACRLEQGAELQPNSTSIEIIVSDTGCGIAPEKLEAMFVTLEGAVDRAEGGGVGLGLAVVARIVEQLQGQLRVESEVNKGTKFYFTCNMGVTTGYQPPTHGLSGLSVSSLTAPSIEPQSSSATAMASLDLIKLAKAREGAATPLRTGLSTSLPVSPATNVTRLPLTTTPAPTLASTLAAIMTSAPTSPIQHTQPVQPVRSKVGPQGSPQLRILVVEDDVINSQILQKRLKMEKHTVRAVENGQEAVDLIASDWDFDAIVMDIQMPIMDGFEAAREIRLLEQRLPALPPGLDPIRIDGRLPIFALSASLYENDRQHLGAHFDGWLLKPLNFKRLRALLQALLDPTKRAEEIYRPGQWERGGYFRDGSGKDAARA